MDNPGQRRPKVIDTNPTLDQPTYSGSIYETNGCFNSNSRPKVQRTIDVINASPLRLSAMYSDGFAFSFDPDRRSLVNEAIVVVQYEISGGVEIPWNIISHNLPVHDVAFLQQVRGHYERDNSAVTYSPVVIRLYFIVDVTDLDYRPNGIYVKPADVQLVSTRHLDVAVPYRRQAQIGVADFNDDRGVSQAATCMAAYVVHDPNEREPLFIASTTGLIVLDPMYTLAMPAGVHRISIGGRKSPGDMSKSEVEHIPIDKLAEHRFFRGLDDFNNNFDRYTKSLPKTDVDKIFKRMQEFLDQHLIPPEVKGNKDQLIDARCFFGHSLKEIITVLEHAVKLKANVEKLVS